MYIIGIDGGGTKSIGCLITAEGEVLSRCAGKPANYRQDAETDILSHITELVHQLIRTSGRDISRVGVLSACLSGLGQESARRRMRNVLGDSFLSDVVFVESDARAALQGAFAGEPGVILIAGTGSIAFAKAPDGSIHRCGGWGYLLGDEGSGFDIGRNGLRAALLDLDGRGAGTSLRQRFETLLGVKRIDQAIPKIYSEYAQRGAMATFAPIVFEEARKGDQVAQKIIIKAAEHLAELVATLIRKLEVRQPFPVAFIGNIFKQRDMLIQPMKQFWNTLNTQVEIVEPAFPPDIGAALLAMQFTGIRLKKTVVQRLKDSMKDVTGVAQDTDGFDSF